MSRIQLEDLADPGSWDRGVDYYEQGNVLSVLEDKNIVVAKVGGRRNYSVRLWLDDDELEGSCSCPMGDRGVFCKHCVATGLAYIESGGDLPAKDTRSRKGRKPKRAITLDDVREYLSRQEADALVEIIMAQILEDDGLRERLTMKAAMSKKGGVNTEAIKQTIREATNTRGFVDYGSAYEFSKRIDGVVDCLEEILAGGYAHEVIALAEYALRHVEKALCETDDSDGFLGTILGRLEQIHHKACMEGRPDPQALAKRLFEWELATDWDTFYNAAEKYADVLGDKGLAVYRGLAEAEWKKLPRLKPGQAELSFAGNRFRLTSIMEALAEAEGDIEALVAMKAKDLSSAHKFLEIAQAYKDAGQSDKARQWAEEGLRAFPKNPDSRLREFLAEEYHLCGRHSEAMQLIWANYVDRPGLDSYRALKKHADRIEESPKWRKQALEHIRAILAGAKNISQTRRYWVRGSDRSMLVEIFLWEKDTEAAWREAQTGGCDDYLWMRLAKAREAEHPADAISVYKAQIDPLVAHTNNRAYQEALGLLRRIRRLSKALHRQEEFQQYVLSLRDKHKRKRNFVKMLATLR